MIVGSVFSMVANVLTIINIVNFYAANPYINYNTTGLYAQMGVSYVIAFAIELYYLSVIKRFHAQA